MAAPIVAGVAAMARELNPDATAADIIRALKESATRPAGSGWNPELGWGIIDAAAALGAVRGDRPPRARVQAHRPHAGAPGALGHAEAGRAPTPRPAALTPSGIDVYEVYRSANRRAYRRIKRTRKTSLKLKVKPGSLYRFYTIAVDKAGNREAAPAKPDLSMRVDRRG